MGLDRLLELHDLAKQECLSYPHKRFLFGSLTSQKGKHFVGIAGARGTGKTVLAKAVAASTDSTFIQIVGSELVQKFIGEGAKLVKDIFRLAREKAPSIIFIDDIYSIASERVDIGTS